MDHVLRDHSAETSLQPSAAVSLASAAAARLPRVCGPHQIYHPYFWQGKDTPAEKTAVSEDTNVQAIFLTQPKPGS